MKKMMYSLFLVIILWINPLFSQVDPSAPVNWVNTGYRGEIPRTFSRIVNMITEKGVTGNGTTDDSPAIQSAINDKIIHSQNEMTIFYFPAGTYKMNSTINIPDGGKNLIFLGEGSNTIFTVPTKVSAFSIGYASQPPWVDLTSDALSLNSLIEGSSSISVPTGSDIQIGDFIEIVIKNGEWLGKYKSTNPQYNKEYETDYQVGQIVKVSAIAVSGGYQQLSLEDNLRRSFSDASLNPKFRKINSVSNIGFENCIVKNTATLSSSEIQSDKDYGTFPINNITFSYATDCWVSGVESDSPLRAHISISSSSGIEIRGCFFHNAKDYGGGGHGYGVSIGDHSTNCLVENNVFDYLRHAMIISRGANGNVFGYNYSNRVVEDYTSGYDAGDISLHGNYSFSNLFEGNISQFANADVYWGANGDKNTLFRNRLEKMPSVGLSIWNSESIDGGIRIDVATVRQNLYIVGNTVPYEEAFLTIFRAQYLPSYAVALNDKNSLINKENENAGHSGSYGKSYYYDNFNQPPFLSGYTWPPVGCKHSGVTPATLSQNIPAKTRWNSIRTASLPLPTVQNLYSVSVKNDLDGVINQGKVGAYETIAGTLQWSSLKSPTTFHLPANPEQQIRTEVTTISYNSSLLSR